MVHDNFVYAAILEGLCGSGMLNEAYHFLYELVDSDKLCLQSRFKRRSLPNC